ADRGVRASRRSYTPPGFGYRGASYVVCSGTCSSESSQERVLTQAEAILAIEALQQPLRCDPQLDHLAQLLDIVRLALALHIVSDLLRQCAQNGVLVRVAFGQRFGYACVAGSASQRHGGGIDRLFCARQLGERAGGSIAVGARQRA